MTTLAVWRRMVACVVGRRTSSPALTLSAKQQKPPVGGFDLHAEARSQQEPGTATQYPTKVSVGWRHRAVKGSMVTSG